MLAKLRYKTIYPHLPCTPKSAHTEGVGLPPKVVAVELNTVSGPAEPV